MMKSRQRSRSNSPTELGSLLKTTKQANDTISMFSNSNNSHYLKTSSAPLSWRLDPDESLSDYTITVISSDDIGKRHRSKNDFLTLDILDQDRNPSEENQNNSSKWEYTHPCQKSHITHPTQVYFVHRAQLAVGPRRSEYFAVTFRQENLLRTDLNHEFHYPTPNKQHNIKIQLAPLAAACFPQLLDFIYSTPGTPTHFTTKTVVPIRHLASCFGIRELFNEATTFIKKDLTIDTAHMYLKAAIDFKNVKLEMTCIEICANNFANLKISALSHLEPSLIIKILESPHFNSMDSELLSMKIASYCRCREDDITLTSLISLTESKRMPKISPEESLFFMSMLQKLGAIFSSLQLSNLSLYDRCFVAAPNLVREAFLFQDDNDYGDNLVKKRQLRQARKTYESLTTEVKVILIEKSLLTDIDNKSYVNPQHLNSKSTSSINKVTRKKKLQKLEAEMEKIKSVYEKKLNFYQLKLKVREEEIQKFAFGGNKTTTSTPIETTKPWKNEVQTNSVNNALMTNENNTLQDVPLPSVHFDLLQLEKDFKLHRSLKSKQ